MPSSAVHGSWTPAPELVGRSAERHLFDELVHAVRGRESQALVVCGEAGVGKTALLEYLAAQATDCRVVRVVGVQSEMELPFAGVQQLCSPLVRQVEALPDPQAQALTTAIGLTPGLAPDRFLVGLAVLGLLSEAAEEQALICLVDDCHWLDAASAQALGFAARRLSAESVGIIFGTRRLSNDLSGLPELQLHGLPAHDARTLLDLVSAGPMDPRIRDQIVAETRGNPLALIELPKRLTPTDLAGGLGLLGASPIESSIEDSYRRQLNLLPEDTMQLLIVCAAEPTGDLGVIWRAVSILGIDHDAATMAIDADLADFADRVRFRHPLIRSAVYRSASQEQRQRAHQALADVIDSQSQSDRRAWHLAQATPGPDEDVATELERCADQAQSRGGQAAAAAFLERAAFLSVEPESRSRRALAAAESKHLAGSHDAAIDLLTVAETGPLSEINRARADMIRAEVSYQEQGAPVDAIPLFLRAARRLETLNPRMARDAYLLALAAAISGGGYSSGHRMIAETAEACLRAPQPDQPQVPSDVFLDGLASAFADGYSTGAPILCEAMSAFRSADVSLEEELRWLTLLSQFAIMIWDDEAHDVFSSRHLELVRQMGMFSLLPLSLTGRILADIHTGDLASAERLVAEQRCLCDAMRVPLPPYGVLSLAAWGGDAGAGALFAQAIPEMKARGEGLAVSVANFLWAILNNGLARYEEALTAALAAENVESDEIAIIPVLRAETIEAGVRLGATEVAKDSFAILAETTYLTGTNWGAGVRVRSEALLANDAKAEDLYRESIDLLGRTRVRPHLARSHLVYGEWLRRRRRPTDAREQLHTAHRMFEAMGLEAFADRSKRELRATGDTTYRRSVAVRGDTLTPQEDQIVELVRIGLSNPEIATRLFISAHTVQYHLRKVYAKLGISSRHQL